jgi:diaminohydroxyphosphoribosylaminopyrimidine deaminase/5-amino-6-(5-phosphoribosylamino)uracil reductase
MSDDRLHTAMIKKAIQLARKGEGYTSPNPMVGAVIFNRDRIIATGYHKKAGGPHAEIVALRKAGEDARGASIAVNLEPCCHVGKTGPCTEAILLAGIKRVIYSIEDPFMRVNGNGARILDRKGIKVIKGICADDATRLNEAYLKYVTTGRPFVVLKTAQSLDGRIATRTGESQWISCPEALTFAHKLRARCDAVAIGSGTAMADNPKLTVRRVKGPNPLRIILTSSDALPTSMTLLAENDGNNTIVATTREQMAVGKYRMVTNWPVRKGKDGLDLSSFLERAGKNGVTSIMFEGGGRLATSLLKKKLVDKFYLIIAPLVIGTGTETVADLGVRRLGDAIRFDKYGFKKIGTDTLFWGYPEK